MEAFREKLGFYSCTVASFEQYTLARFISGGYFEKHINRMRKFYRARRDRVASALERCPLAGKMTILEADAGLHFLVKMDVEVSDAKLTSLWAQAGIRVRTLSSYYHEKAPKMDGVCLVINYSGLDEEELCRLETIKPCV
jgi:GntR family transcriptional regulator/MocR family aminotransferase